MFGAPRRGDTRPQAQAQNLVALVALAGPRSRLACRKFGGAFSDDPACEPAKFPPGLLLVLRLLVSVTVMVMAMVPWAELLAPRLRAPDATAFELVDQHSRLACRKLGGAFSDDPACEPAKVPAGSLLVMRLLVSVTAMVVVMVTRVEPLVSRFRAPDATALALADPQPRLAGRRPDPACEPRKVCTGLLLMLRLQMPVTVMVMIAVTIMVLVMVMLMVMVTWLEPQVPRFLAPTATAFDLAAPHSGLACRRLTGASLDDPACESEKAFAGLLLVMRMLVLVTVVMVVRLKAVPTFRAPKATVDRVYGSASRLAVYVLASIAVLALTEAMAAARLC